MSDQQDRFRTIVAQTQRYGQAHGLPFPVMPEDVRFPQIFDYILCSLPIFTVVDATDLEVEPRGPWVWLHLPQCRDGLFYLAHVVKPKKWRDYPGMTREELGATLLNTMRQAPRLRFGLALIYRTDAPLGVAVFVIPPPPPPIPAEEMPKEVLNAEPKLSLPEVLGEIRELGRSTGDADVIGEPVP